MMTAARLVLIAAVSFTGIASAAHADSSIRLTVNDQAITSYDIAQRAKLMQIAGEKGGEKAAIEQLIDEALEVGDAKLHGIGIPQGRVDDAFASIADRMKMTPPKLTQALASQGIAAETLKRRIRAQMTWQAVIQARSRFNVSVKSSDIMQALNAQGDPDKIKTREFMLQQIIFVVPKGSSASYIAQRRREAEAYRLRFAGCDKSIELAKGLKDVAVRNIGRRTSDMLTGDDGKEVQNTPAGKTTRPVSDNQGVSIVAVCSVREIASNAAAVSQMEDKLSLEQNKDAGKDYLKKLRDKAVIKYR
jgi:peptidyl-prolyl cis-trans isomerase SurA